MARCFGAANSAASSSAASSSPPPRLFLLADSHHLFATTLFSGDLPIGRASFEDKDVNQRCWFDVVIGAAVRQTTTSTKKIACYIGAANGDMVEFFEMGEVATAKVGCASCRFVKTRATADDLDCIAKEAALVLIAGGDPVVGWEAMARNGVCDALKEAHERGAVLVGISAGAMILGSWCFELGGDAAKKTRTWPALGLVPFAIAPHREASDWSEARKVLREDKAEEAAAMLGLPYQSGVCVHPDGTLTPLPAGRETVKLLSAGDDASSSDCVLEHFPPTRYRLHRSSTYHRQPLIARPWLPELGEDLRRRARALREKLAEHAAPISDDVDMAALRGPNKYSNWLLPGRVVIGCYPCNEVWRREGGASAVKEALRTLCEEARCTLFVCLDDSPELLRRRWNGGSRHALEPKYVDAMPQGWKGGARVFTTEDGGAFEWSTLLDCLEAVVDHYVAEQAGEKGAAYVHCFGGHGRAGVVGACFLGLVHGWGSAAALEQTQRRHDAREDPAWPCDVPQRSPQTEVQRVQVEMLLQAAGLEVETQPAKEEEEAPRVAGNAPCLNCHLDPVKKAAWHAKADDLNDKLDAMIAARAAARAKEGE